MKLTQVFNGYADADQYGVVITFELEGKEYGAYVNFNRVPRTIDSVQFFEGDEANLIPQPDGVVLAEIETAARDYFEKGR